MSFGQLLKKYREKKKISQAVLGRQCNPSFTQIYLTNLETGLKKPPPDKTIFNIAQTLNLSSKQIDKLLQEARKERSLYSFKKYVKQDPEIVAHCLIENFTPDDLTNIYKIIERKLAVSHKLSPSTI